jgi:hypothetical protein
VTRIGFEDTTQIRKDWLFNARRVRQWMKSSKRCSLLCIALVLTHGWPNKRSQGTLPIEDQYIYIYMHQSLKSTYMLCYSYFLWRKNKGWPRGVIGRGRTLDHEDFTLVWRKFFFQPLFRWEEKNHTQTQSLNQKTFK